MRDVAGHEQRGLGDGLVDLHVQVDQAEVLVVRHGRHEGVRGQRV